MQLTPLPEAIARFRAGGFVALLDSPDREGEADLLAAAETITGDAVNFMATHARGLVTLAIDADRLNQLDIRRIEPRFHGDNVPAFTEPVDYTPAVTTGVSAFERAATIRALVDPSTKAEDFMRPGHVFPIAAHPEGLAKRQGHTEGAIALARLARLSPAVVMCELMAPSGHMAKADEIARWAAEHNVALCSVEQIANEVLGKR